MSFSPLTYTKSVFINKVSFGLIDIKNPLQVPCSISSQCALKICDLPSAQLDHNKWKQNCARHSINGIFRTEKKKLYICCSIGWEMEKILGCQNSCCCKEKNNVCVQCPLLPKKNKINLSLSYLSHCRGIISLPQNCCHNLWMTSELKASAHCKRGMHAAPRNHGCAVIFTL